MIPEQYQWLEKLRCLPMTIRLGLDQYGVQEIIGSGSSRTILAWRDELNLAGVKIAGFSDDSIPWCGLFAAVICFRRVRNPAEVVKSPLWARSWISYGRSAPAPALGDVLVFSRGTGGHVGFYAGEDATAFHVLGGNQSDKVCITRIAKSRLLAARRPPYKTQPQAVRPYQVASSGALSTNES